MPTDIADAVARLMPELKRDLARLVEIPSVSAPSFPPVTRPTLLEAHRELIAMFAEAGVQQIDSLELPDTAPVIIGEIPAPPGAPTVLLYSHYDVVPAGDEDDWESPPFVASERDGAIYGRGTADSKSNILIHLGALRAWDGRPPVGVKLVLEGQEEVGSPLEHGYATAHPEPFACDVMMIADGGNLRPGLPSITSSLRGDASITVSARTLKSPKHSGQYGGAAPDSLLALVRALASLHDEHGDVAVSGLSRSRWGGAPETEDEFRKLAEVLPGVPLVGSGDLSDRLWSGPAITVTGIDAPTVEAAVNAVSAHARARLNVRVDPEQDPEIAQAAVIAHLQAQCPFGIALDVEAGDTGRGVRMPSTGPAWAAMAAAMARAWGAEAVEIATGGAIPLVSALVEAVPRAEVLLFGTADRFANIHGPNERVLVDEFQKAVLAEALFFEHYAHHHGER